MYLHLHPGDLSGSLCVNLFEMCYQLHCHPPSHCHWRLAVVENIGEEKIKDDHEANFRKFHAFPIRISAPGQTCASFQGI